MTLKNLEECLKTAGMPVTYHHWEVGEVPALPYLIYYENSSNDAYADNMAYAKIPEVTVELYTDRKDPETESRLEAVFDENEIPYTWYESWLESEEMFLRGNEFELKP